MGVKTIRYSDLSGEEIHGDGATLRLNWHDRSKTPLDLDVTKEEAEEFAEKGHPIQRRNRGKKED